jgi:hypothetical protein
VLLPRAKKLSAQARAFRRQPDNHAAVAVGPAWTHRLGGDQICGGLALRAFIDARMVRPKRG